MIRAFRRSGGPVQTNIRTKGPSPWSIRGPVGVPDCGREARRARRGRDTMGRTWIDKIGYGAVVWGLWALSLLWSSPAIAAEGTDPAAAPKDRPVPPPLSSSLTFETKALPLTRQDAVYL